MRILVTGSRYLTEKSLETIYQTLLSIIDESDVSGEVVVIHGGARGADALAWQAAMDLGARVEVYPADWSRGKRAGMERNQVMVDKGADVCVAFPIADSRGTRDCIRRARAAGIPVKIVHMEE